MDLNFTSAQIAVRRMLLEDVSPLQILSSVDHKAHEDKGQAQQAQAAKNDGALTPAQTKQVLQKFQPLSPVLKTAIEGTRALRQGFQSLKNLIRDPNQTPVTAVPVVPIVHNATHEAMGATPNDKGIQNGPPLTGVVAQPQQRPPLQKGIAPATNVVAGRAEQPKADTSLPTVPREEAVHPVPAPPMNAPKANLRQVPAASEGQPRPVLQEKGNQSQKSQNVLAPPKTAPLPLEGNKENPRTALNQAQVHPAEHENLPAGGPAHLPPPVVPGTSENHPEPAISHDRPVGPVGQTPQVPPIEEKSVRPVLATNHKPQNEPAPQVEKNQGTAQIPTAQKVTASTTPKAQRGNEEVQSINATVGKTQGTQHVHIETTRKTQEAGLNNASKTTVTSQFPIEKATVNTATAQDSTKEHPAVNTVAGQTKGNTNPAAVVTTPVTENRQEVRSNVPAEPEQPTRTPQVANPVPIVGETKTGVAKGLENPRLAEQVAAISATVSKPLATVTGKNQEHPPVNPIHTNEPAVTVKPVGQAQFGVTQGKPAERTNFQQAPKSSLEQTALAPQETTHPTNHENLPAGGPAQVPPFTGREIPMIHQIPPPVRPVVVRPIETTPQMHLNQLGDHEHPVTRLPNPPEQTRVPEAPRSLTNVEVAQRQGKIQSTALPKQQEEIPVQQFQMNREQVNVVRPEQNLPKNLGGDRSAEQAPLQQQNAPIQKNEVPAVQTHAQPLVNTQTGKVPENNVQTFAIDNLRQPAKPQNLPAAGNPHVTIPVTAQVPPTHENISNVAATAVRPVIQAQAASHTEVELNRPRPTLLAEGNRVVISAPKENTGAAISLPRENLVPPPAILSPKPGINAVPETQIPVSAVLQSLIEDHRPLVIPPGAPVGGSILAPGLTKDQAIQAFQRSLREAGSRTAIEEARKTTDLLQQHPLVNSQTVTLTSPQTIRVKEGDTAQTVTQLTGPAANNRNFGPETVARTIIHGDNRSISEPIKQAEVREVGPQNGSRLPVRPPAHAVPPLLNVNGQLRQTLPTNARSRLVAVATVNLLDLVL